jgi:WXG100 family type VII secretion target
MVLINVNFTSLEGIATQLETARGQLETHLQSLKTAMAPALDVWEGDDRNAYDTQALALENVCRDMGTHLLNLKSAVTTSGQGYHDNEQLGVRSLQV